MATEKQERAIQIYVAHKLAKRGISIAEAMRRAGYAEKTARNPKNLTRTEAWDEMLEKYLPDERLLRTHQDLLKANKLEHMVFPVGLPDEEIREMLLELGCKPRRVQHGEQATHVWFWAPDTKTRGAAVDLAYKLKGKLKQKVEHSGQVDGLFGADALTITVVNSSDDVEHNPGA